jgi:hypothetical protein
VSEEIKKKETDAKKQKNFFFEKEEPKELVVWT